MASGQAGKALDSLATQERGNPRIWTGKKEPDGKAVTNASHE